MSLTKDAIGGKFSLLIENLAHTLSLDGTCETLGSVEENGHYTKLENLTVEEYVWAKTEGENLNQDDLDHITKHPHAIVCENGQGFVSVDWYETQAELDSAWAQLEAEDAENHPDEDEDEDEVFAE